MQVVLPEQEVINTVLFPSNHYVEHQSLKHTILTDKKKKKNDPKYSHQPILEFLEVHVAQHQSMQHLGRIHKMHEKVAECHGGKNVKARKLLPRKCWCLVGNFRIWWVIWIFVYKITV